jgi:histidine ammonia-lyase
MDAVTISDAPLRLEELLRVVDGAPVALDDRARTTIAASRAVIDRMLEGDEPVYGLNTGVGHLKDTRLPADELRSTQMTLLMSHAGGLGAALPTPVVRAAMAVRLNGIARGGSGASPRVAEVLAAMLNRGVHPLVAERGSVGAGDLGQMASVGEVMIGAGRAEIAGEVLPGAAALARAGIEPLTLEPKDGLTIMSSNGFSIGAGALVVERAAALARRADAVAALSLETTTGNPSITDPAVGDAKPFPGQIAAVRSIAAALEGSDLLRPGASRSVQDPLSFRVIPQVHGTLREAIAATRRAVEVELNGQGDNPLVSIHDAKMVHNGNFHPLVMAIAFDQLRVALAHVGQLAERRMSHLWDAFFGRIETPGGPGGAAEPADGPGSSSRSRPPELFGVSLRYPAAAVLAELRHLAAPATLDVPPLDMGIEDHSTGAPLSVEHTDRSLSLLEELQSIEALLAADVLGLVRPTPTLGGGASRIMSVMRSALDALGDERTPAGAQRAVALALRDI